MFHHRTFWSLQILVTQLVVTSPGKVCNRRETDSGQWQRGFPIDAAELEETKGSFQWNTTSQPECRREVWSEETGHYLVVALKTMGAGKLTENDPETGEWREGTMPEVWWVKKETEITTAVTTTVLLTNAQM